MEQLKLIVDRFNERREREAKKRLLAQKKMLRETREFETLRQRKKDLERDLSVKLEALKPLEVVMKIKKESAFGAQKEANIGARNVANIFRAQVWQLEISVLSYNISQT